MMSPGIWHVTAPQRNHSQRGKCLRACSIYSSYLYFAFI